MRVSRLMTMTVGLALAALPAGATLVYTVSLDSAGLIGHPAGPFSLNLQLTDGTGLGDGNNTVTLSAFDFGVGAPLGSPTMTGGVTGDLSTQVTLIDSGFFNSFTQSFTPGSTLSFALVLTTFADAGGTPDEFSVAILDSSGHEIPTLGLATIGTDSLMVIDIAVSPSISVYGSDPDRSPFAGGEPIAFAPPTLTPEPASFALTAWGLGLLALILGRRRVFDAISSLLRRQLLEHAGSRSYSVAAGARDRGIRGR